MIRAIDPSNGNAVNLDGAIFEAECPVCNRLHRIDLADKLTALDPRQFESFHDVECLCAQCSATHPTMLLNFPAKPQ